METLRENSPGELGSSLSHKLQGCYTSQLVVSDFFHQQYIYISETILQVTSPFGTNFGDQKVECDTCKRYPKKKGGMDSSWKMWKMSTLEGGSTLNLYHLPFEKKCLFFLGGHLEDLGNKLRSGPKITHIFQHLRSSDFALESPTWHC